MIRKLSLALMLILVPAGFVLGASDGSWLKKVPARDHEKANPYQGLCEITARIRVCGRGMETRFVGLICGFMERAGLIFSFLL